VQFMLGVFQNRKLQPAKSALPPRRYGVSKSLATLLVLTGLVLSAQQAPPGSPDRPYLLPEANRLPDVNQQMAMRDKQTKQQSFEAANAERKKQIVDDTAKLLKLAADLKAEVAKTDKDTLSLSVIRKADEIERLAHNIKEKMKLMAGGG